MIRTAAILQLLLGNIGIPGGGMNAERGHANIQGNTDNAQSWELLPGYLAIPTPGMETIDAYVDQKAFAKLDPDSINYFGEHYRAFLVSLLKAWFGDAADAGNDFAYSWLPKPDKDWSWLTIHDEAFHGRLHGLFNGGMSTVNIGPDSNRMIQTLSRLRWYVVMDPFPTASSEFWHAPGVDPATVQTEVFFFPTTHWIEKSGSFTNSGRWVQWKHAALPLEGDIRNDVWILAQLRKRLVELYETEGGAFPDPILNLTWEYSDPDDPPLDEVAMEINGKDLATGRQLATFDDARENGTTSIGNWIYTGSFTDAGKHDGPPGDGGSHGARLLPRLDVVVAGQPPGSVQPRVRRSSRPALGSGTNGHRVERDDVGGGRAGLRRDLPAEGRARRVHHERRGRGSAVRAGPPAPRRSAAGTL